MKKCLICLFLVLSCLVFSSCDNSPNCEHHYEWMRNKDSHYQQCSKCDKIRNEADHEFDNGQTIKEPTMVYDGEKKYTCSTCDYSKIEIIPKLDDLTVDDDCSHTFVWKYNETMHYQQCSKCNKTQNQGDHNFDGGKITIQPTTSSNGQKEYKCETCNYIKTTIVDKLISSESSNNEYADMYKNYTALGRTINMISGTGLQTIVGGSRVFSDKIYGVMVEEDSIGDQHSKSYSSSSLSDIADDFFYDINEKIDFGSRTDKNGRWLTNALPSINVNYDTSYTKLKKSETNEYCYNYSYFLNSKRATIYGSRNLDFLKSMLSEDVLKDAERLQNGEISPEWFINKWGTHVVTSAIYGEKVNVTYTKIFHKENNLEDWKLKLDAELELRLSKIGVEGQIGTGTEKLNSLIEADTIKNLNIKVTSNLPFAASSFESFNEKYSKWIENHKDIDYSVFIDVPAGSLIFVWDLLPNRFENAKEMLDDYALEKCQEQYHLYKKKINDFYRNEDVVYDVEEKALNFNLNEKYDKKIEGELEITQFNNDSDFNGIYVVMPKVNSNPVEVININGLYKKENGNGQAINTILKNFSLKFDSNWKNDVVINIYDLGLVAANDKSFLDLTDVSANINVTINFYGNCKICGGNGKTAGAVYYGPSTNLVLNSSESATIELIGGKGSDGDKGYSSAAFKNNNWGTDKYWHHSTRRGENGYDGQTAIYSKNVTINMKNATITGGAGGNGGAGGDCWEKGLWSWEWPKGTSTQEALSGGAGGNGGNGASAIKYTGTMSNNSSISLIGGAGGIGGTHGQHDWSYQGNKGRYDVDGKQGQTASSTAKVS